MARLSAWGASSTTRQWAGVTAFCALILAQPGVVSAHGNVPLVPSQLWSAWVWDPLTLVLIFVSGLAYDLGVSKLWAKAGRGHGIHVWQTFAYKGGLMLLFVALVSPLDALSSVLFSAHMAQHLLLILSAPLFVISAVPLAFLWTLPLAWRRTLSHRWQAAVRARRVWSVLTRPLVAWLIFAAALWGWHFPAFYQAALGNDLIHAVEHGCFVAASALFWWALIKPGHYPTRDSMRSYGGGVLSAFSTGLHSSILGALLVFSTQLWYPAYAQGVAPWGLTPLTDQQLAGLIMWLPMGIFYLGAAAALLLLWLNGLERTMQRREHAITRLHGLNGNHLKRLKPEVVD